MIHPLTPAALAAAAIFALAVQVAGAADRGSDRAADAYQLGLWDVAAREYLALIQVEDEPAARATLTTRLAECLVREGRPAAALPLLESDGADMPVESAFWRGQALAGLGRFSDAVDALLAYLEKPAVPHRIEAALTASSLMLSLDDRDGALRVLATAAASADVPERARLDLQRAATLLDAGRPEEAREVLPEESELPPSQVPYARLVVARLLLDEGRADEAAGIFATLLDEPAGQSLTTHHAAALGLADAVLATSGPEASSRVLLAFLINHPETPVLDAAFRRLLHNLPEEPAANDAVLAKLAEWIPQPPAPVTGAVPTGDSAASGWPTARGTGDLAAFAMFTRAIGLHRIGTPSARNESRRLMTRLRFDFPNHFIARRSLLVEGRWRLDDGDSEGALHRLSVAADTSRSPASRGEAVFLEARAAAAGGDMVAAAIRFEEAATLLDAELASMARFNAAVARIRENPESAGTPDLGDPALAADLMLERALALATPDEAVTALDAFLLAHPAHPRAAEARLAAAERALVASPADVSFARAQIDTLSSSDARVAVPGADGRIALVRLRLAEHDTETAAEPEAAIELARQIIAENPGTPAADEATLTLGRLLFDTGNFNEARINFEKLAAANTPAEEVAADPDAGDPALAQTAWLLAARAAALGATIQSREEALTLFDRAIAIDAPLRGFAMLEKSRHLIDLNQLDAATTFLREAIAAMDGEDDPQRLPAGLLLGEAIYAKGTGDATSLEEALAIYDGLLPHATTHPALYHRLQYLRGMTLEKLPQADAPGHTREAEAIEAYYSVIQRAGDQPPVEWEWFERCGFGALALLEKGGRYEAAIQLARKIAAYNGPRAKDAAERASQLQLKHMIWED